MGGFHSSCGPCYLASHDEDSSRQLAIRSSKVNASGEHSRSSSHNFPYFSMSEEKKNILRKHFRATLKEQRPDIFHKTMLLCIHSSPKLNEIIACQVYCFRDLTKWPKLNRVSQAQFDFFERMVEQYNLDNVVISESSYQLGVIHFRYAEFGLKPHFLDLWRQHLEKLLQKLHFEKPEEKTLFCDAFKELMGFVTETINFAYSRCQQEAALKSKEKMGTLQ